MQHRFSTSITSGLFAFFACTVHAGEWSGYVAGELRAFPHAAVEAEQDHHWNASILAEPEYFHESDDGRQLFEFSVFARLDDHDSERTHWDVRELSWLYAAESWELRLGIRKVFWGVAESNHLVDIINQTDLVENIDTEDKLGQPMINFAVLRDWGTVDVFVMPYFRERTYPGRDGRLRTQPYVDTDLAKYESAAEEHHVDLAIRYSHYIGDFDFGISHFYGTSRDPRLLPTLRDDGVVLAPFYDIIHQTGIDIQATKGDWLWKLEMISRHGQADASGDDHFFAMVGGFEYTFVGVFDSAVDVGVIGEYVFDDRDEFATTPFEDDVVTGVRIALNDAQSTEILAGVTFDMDSSAKFFNLEASRRLGANWKVELESRFFTAIPEDDLQYLLRDDDVIQLTLARYF